MSDSMPGERQLSTVRASKADIPLSANAVEKVGLEDVAKS